MGLVSRMARPKAMNSHELEKMIRSAFGGGTTSSGMSVTNDTAMRQATVYSCVNIISRVMGMVPCHLMKRDGRDRFPATDEDLYQLLHDMPNEWMTAPEFWGMAANHVALRGNFFALKNRGLNKTTGRIREIIPTAPGFVQEVKQDENYRLVYRCQYPDGTQKDIPQSEIMHIRGMVQNGYMGVNPIQYVRESVALDLAATEFGARYFGSGTHPGIIIEHPNELSPQASSNLRNSLTETYSGLGKAHRLMILEEGMKAQKITIDPKDAQFLELRAFQKSEIVDIFFGIPLTLMGGGEKSTPTFASAEQFSISFIVYACTPYAVWFEKASYRDLLTPEERKKYYVKFEMRGLQRGSFKEQMEAFATAIDKEIMNPNECRELLDMNPYKGGDVYRTRTSTVKESGAGGAAK